jgi:hypothetical protein
LKSHNELLGAPSSTREAAAKSVQPGSTDKAALFGALVAAWRAEGCPVQSGIRWPRRRWIEALPEERAVFDSLPDLLDRATVRTACANANERPENARRAFVAVMAWGYGMVGYGPYRTRRVLAVPNSASRLAEAAEILLQDGATAAYGSMAGRCRLRGLGPAFGTKYLHFCSQRDVAEGALILDRLVSGWLSERVNRVFVSGRWSIRSYAAYLDAMQGWAHDVQVTPEVLEELIFTDAARAVGSQWAFVT